MFRLERPDNPWHTLLSQTAGNITQSRAADIQHQKKTKEIADVLGPLNDESSPFEWMRAINSLRHTEPEEKKQLYGTIQEVNKQKAIDRKARAEAEKHRQEGMSQLKAFGLLPQDQSQAQPSMSGMQAAGVQTPRAQLPGGVTPEEFLAASPAARKTILSPLKPMGGLEGQPIPEEYRKKIDDVLATGEKDPERLRQRLNRAGIPPTYSNRIVEDRREAVKNETEENKTKSKEDIRKEEKREKSKEKNAAFINDVFSKEHRFEARTKPTYMAMNAYSDKEVMLSPFFRHLVGPGMAQAIDAYNGDSTAENMKKLENILVGNISQEGYGSRILAVEFENYMRQIPGLMMSPQGRRKVVAGNLKMGEVNKILANSTRKLERKYDDENVDQPSNFQELVFNDALPEIQRVGKEAEFIAKLSDDRPEQGKTFYITPNGKGIIQIDDTDEERARFEALGAHPTYLSNPLPQSEQEEEREREGEDFLRQVEQAEAPQQFQPPQPMQPEQPQQMQQPANQEERQEAIPMMGAQQAPPETPNQPPQAPLSPNVNPYDPGIREEQQANQEAQKTGIPQPTPSQHGIVELLPNQDPKKTEPRYQQKVEESWTEWAGRNFKGVKHDVFEKLCNLPKDVFGMVAAAVNSAPNMKTDPFYRWMYGNEKYEEIKAKNDPKTYLPGFDEVKKAIKFIGADKAFDFATGIDVDMEPARTPGEKKFRDVASNMAITGVTAPLALGGVNRIIWTASPAVGAIGGEIAKAGGMSEENARYVEIGTELLTNLASVASPTLYLNMQMTRAARTLNPIAINRQVEQQLENTLRNNLINHFPANSPATAIAREQTQTLLTEIEEARQAGRPLTTGQVLNRYNAINASAEAAGLYDVERAGSGTPIHSTGTLKHQIMDSLEQNTAHTGSQVATGALETWQNSITSRRVMHTSNRLQNTVKSWLDPILKHAVGKVAVLSATAGGVHLYPIQTALLFGVTGGLAGVHKAAQVFYRCAANPNLLNYYTRAVRDIMIGNKASFLLNYKKLTSLYQKEFEKKDRISNAPKAKPKKKS